MIVELKVNKYFYSINSFFIIINEAVKDVSILFIECNENLAEIERQTKKFSSNVQKSQEFDIFPIDDVKEIIEPYDEETEKLWRGI